MELSSKARLMRDWLLTEWSDKLAMILESMADKRPVVERSTAEGLPSAPSPGTSLWAQKLAISAEPLLWVGSPTVTADDLGRRTLTAAGLDTIEDEDARNTYSEILNQSLSALAQSITGHLHTEASTTEGAVATTTPENLEWIPVSLSFDGQSLEPLWFAASPQLLDRLAQDQAEESEQPSAAPAPASAPLSNVGLEGVSSKTFDLLLDVALPVSVSFGRTFLPVKDVLKLNSGSIVELERGISEPVDIIVNNCVIARGEVVVIEGNYGVRIQQIASRHDRLRTGRDATHVQHALTLT